MLHEGRLRHSHPLQLVSRVVPGVRCQGPCRSKRPSAGTASPRSQRRALVLDTRLTQYMTTWLKHEYMFCCLVRVRYFLLIIISMLLSLLKQQDCLLNYNGKRTRNSLVERALLWAAAERRTGLGLQAERDLAQLAWRREAQIICCCWSTGLCRRYGVI